MAPPSYARPTLSFLLKFNSPKAPLAAQSLATGSRQESTAFKASLGIESEWAPAVLLTVCSRTAVTIIASAARRLLTKKQNCTTCDLNLPLTEFPRRPEGSTCKHLSETCQDCWREWLAEQVESKHFDQISCAQCSNVLGQNEIRTLATPAVYERYLDASFKATMSAMPDFRWCMAAECKSGQVHSEGDIFCCVQCSHKACVNCNTAWHADETCKVYQGRLIKQPEEEEASARKLGRMSKLCPGCSRRVSKR
ncbi:hypothetical protein LTR97_007877 [Elasticomyces elasticus]|uniref:RBR-type E3 ubiquitin transferase n=1 Tax=Elasticomyces elasticus TaxID=574655 RepID=A0AAN8A0H7_9PEZI|nr:hypothetical protein LTR97_007877 [Elasticomyces elasticus]